LVGFCAKNVFSLGTPSNSLPTDELGNWCHQRLVGVRANPRHSREVPWQQCEREPALQILVVTQEVICPMYCSDLERSVQERTANMEID